MTISADNNKAVLLMDEAWTLMSNNDDDLKRELRKIDGVPNATYLVDGARVFVFDKLVDEVKKFRAQSNERALAEIALEVLPSAWLSADDAVRKWNIVPVPYAVVGAEPAFRIRHERLASVIPVELATRDDVDAALSTILLGGQISANGDFTYKGQVLKLDASFDPTTLPQRPQMLTEGLEKAGFASSILSGTEFEEGFSPISKDVFENIKSLAETWRDQSGKAGKYVYSATKEDIAALFSRLPVAKLNDDRDSVPEYGGDDAQLLRGYFPELAELSDGSLYEWFDSYQNRCCYISGWTAGPDDGFLFYLIGKMSTGKSVDGEQCRSVGEFVAFELLRGVPVETALSAGVTWNVYDTAVSSLAFRTWEAMRFLKEDKAAFDLRGGKVTTMLDMFYIGRKSNFSIAPVTQTLEQFAARASDSA